MKLGVRGKLFAVSVGLILAVVLASGFYLQGELRGVLEQRIETELEHHAHTVRVALEAHPTNHSAEIDSLADQMSGDTGTRVTVIAADGRVLGDSDLTISELATIDNHGARPEVIAARSTGQGGARRFSRTLEADLMYVAVAYRQPHGETGVVRVARTLSSVNAAVGRLRLILLAAGLIGLLVAVAMSGLASHFMSRTLRQLVESAREIASGQARERIAVSSTDELAGLAGSLNQMAEDIEDTVGELADERARFKAVLESLTDAVVALDADNEVVLMNPSALELFGLEGAPPSTPILSLLRAPGLQELLAAEGELPSTEFEMPGTSRRVMVRRSSMRSGTVLVFQDVTEIRHLETVRRDFVANVSHELRTPVSIVRANAETLLDGAMSDPVHGTRLLEATLRNSERLSSIITDLLDLSRLEAGRFEPKAIAISAHEVAARAVEAVEQKALAREMAIVLDVPEDVAFVADSKALEQIVLNFLENAIKYTPENGHVWLTARFTGNDDDSTVRLEVRDDGPGIEPRHRARVFERFYRIDPGRSRDMGGTGLGLSIVKHLAEAMGGTVGLEPAEPHGSVFWVELPGATVRHRPGEGPVSEPPS